MKNVRIGTRQSPLALWQAREVARNLQNRNIKTDIVPILSSGDKNLSQPLYSLGITGISVSYTHLDVYKRQLLWFQPATNKVR